MSNRREFLKTSSGLAAALAIAPAVKAETPKAATLPSITFGKHQVSRLIVGCNQFYGYSHFNPLLDQLMRDWNTPERVAQTLHQCEKNGINTYQYSHHDRCLADLERFRDEGGKMHIIGTNSGKTPVEEVVKSVRPIALYHHGEATDVLFRDGKMDQVLEYCKRLRQTGVLVGVGTHKSEVVEYAEERGWDVDFYTLCVYNRTRTPEELRKILGTVPVAPREVYLEEDPPRAFRVARQTKKTCFLFKILAAGRLIHTPETIDNAFKTALESIKPQDGIIVGMYPRFKDEVAENADRVRRILQA